MRRQLKRPSETLTGGVGSGYVVNLIVSGKPWSVWLPVLLVSWLPLVWSEVVDRWRSR